jgi:hypothetical protein
MGEGGAAAGRLLLLSPHFAPSSEAGALRWEMLAPYARERGWGLDVLCYPPSAVAEADAERLGRLPSDLRAFGVDRVRFAFEDLEQALHRLRQRGSRRRRPPGDAGQGGGARPASFARADLHFHATQARSWIRAYNVSLELARERAWGRRAVVLGRALLEPGRHRAIVSCGPPHGVHEAARRLSLAAGLPAVLDMRDPWSLTERLPEELASSLFLRAAARLEARCVRHAGLVAMNTEPAAAAMRVRYPACAERIVAVPNGVDPDEPLPRAERGARFLVAYAGAVYLDRNPATLFRAAARLVRDLALTPDDFGIEFMGRVDGPGPDPLGALARAEGIEAFVRSHPPGPRSRAAVFLARAAVLVNLHQDSRLAIPSKVYEYMRYDAWLLALCDPGSATHDLLAGSGADVVHPDDVAGIRDALERRFQAYRRGERPRPLGEDPRFGRRAQAERLFEHIEALVPR